MQQSNYIQLKSGISSGKELIRVYVEFNNQQIRKKFPHDTKILYFEEYLKRNLKVSPTQAIYLFEKRQRKLLNKTVTIGDYAKHSPQDMLKMKEESEEGKIYDRQLKIIVRKTDTY